MGELASKRPWWRKRRWAAALAALVLAVAGAVAAPHVWRRVMAYGVAAHQRGITQELSKMAQSAIIEAIERCRDAWPEDLADAGLDFEGKRKPWGHEEG